MSIEHDCAQYSDEWYKLHIGIPTSSGFHNIITPAGVPTRGDKRNKYMFKLIAERLLQQSMDGGYSSYWMKRGREVEIEAATAFEQQGGMTRGWYLDKVGFVTDDKQKFGASPDRVLKRHGGSVKHGLEIKCPSPWVQVEYLLRGPEDNYKPQLQGAMYVCGYDAMHLWSYHPLMPPVHFIAEADEDYQAKLAKELFFFCNELDVETDRARRMGPFKLAELLRLSAEMADSGEEIRFN
jgi:hypothetical protein